ncbi:MAG: UDP-N-acetylmuramoyl-L-alanine--D-glutamate ligase [Ardenticatenia bacterium]|jgi:UDP-N-acetylmuramoylalanine--D-glutamate ligase|nr:MAG: UDP-N-acetylmuramoyl-L-alanine--D-glutamate ligase [Ardenticatenia bacterium]
MHCSDGNTMQVVDMDGHRVVVVGLAREGEALTRFLASHKCQVVATDLRPAEAFGERLAKLTEAGVQLVLGEHPFSVLDGAEVVFVSPGVPFDAPLLNEARRRGLPLSTESRLFCALCAAPIVGITGSSGKTTTTALVGEMLRTDGRNVWVGGNIGQPLIEKVEQIRVNDWVVVELSSFQLEYYHPSANAHVRDVHPIWMPLLCGWSPHIGAILNVTPNHLDRHPSMEAYTHAKRAIVAYRKPEDIAVLNHDNPITRAIGGSLSGDVRWFSRRTPVPAGAYLAKGKQGLSVVVSRGSTIQHDIPKVRPVCRLEEIRLRGEHNVDNILAACAIADTLGVSLEAMHQVCTTFSGVAHRLEWVADVAGVHYYNDSIATTPERLSAALRSFREPIVLLAGGRDKHLPWDEAVRLMLARTCHIILFGEAATLIHTELAKVQATVSPDRRAPWPTVHRTATLDEAVELAASVAQAGNVVLLSPGCTSFDAFKDFAERGDRFRELVERLQRRAERQGSLDSAGSQRR